MRTHIGKLHVRRTAQKPADVHPIQIEEGPIRQAPAFAIQASSAMGSQRQPGDLTAPTGLQNEVLGPFANPITLESDQDDINGSLAAVRQPALIGLPAPGALREISEEDQSAELAPEAAAQEALLNPEEADQTSLERNYDTARDERQRAQQQPAAEGTQESPPQQQNSAVAPEAQQPADAPAPQLSSPDNSANQAEEGETASPAAELSAQELQADQPAQVPPPAAEGNGQGSNVSGGDGDGQGGNVGGQGGGPALTPLEQAPAALDTSGSGPMVQSLGKQQPTAIVASLGVVPGQLTTAQQGDLEQAKTHLPEIDQPTGLGSDEVTDKKAVKSELKEENSPEIQTPKDGKKQEVKTEHKTPEGKSPAEKVKTPSNEALKQPGALGSAIQNIPEVDPSISTNAGSRPQVELTGDADPRHNQTAQNEANTSTQEASSKARTETEKDFKEGEILPEVEKETMKVQQALTAPEGWNAQGGAVLPELDAQSAAALNSGIVAQHQAQLDAELAKETQGKAEFDQKAREEQQKGLDKIKEENEKVKQQQLDERSKGKQTIDSHREEWRAENDKVMEDFDKQSKAEREKVDGQIQTKVTETNAKVESEYAKAESEAEAATAKSQAEIEAEKLKAKDKEKNKSWWDKVCDAVSDFFDALKKAVSAIFEALKKAVKAIIEVAKKLASQLIDMARDLIKGLISAFADMLKAFVRLALAAFPELANKFCALIDQAVEAIHKAIDQLAEALKAVVNLLLDAIGAAINALLDAYNAIINAILSAIELLAVGWLRIMEGIANLVEAAVQSPDHLMGQLSEELLGQDISKPLENEYASSAATTADTAKEQVDLVESESIQTEAPHQDAAAKFLEKPSYEKGDFEVPVLQGAVLSPEMNLELSQMGDGEHEFDGSGEGIQGLKAPSTPANEKHEGQQESPIDSTPNPESESALPDSPTQAAVPANSNGDRFTPDENGMVGPFEGPWERVKYMGKMAWNGIKETAQKYKYAIIGGIAAAVALVIFSGGAIMGAVPPLLAILGFADMAYNIGKYLGTYLTAGFAGQIAQGAAALARVFVIIGIELLFALLGTVFGGKAALTGLKNSAKNAAKGGAKGLAKTLAGKAKGAIKGLKGQAQSLKESLGKSWKMIKSGDGVRLSMNSIKSATVKAAKTIRDLGRKIGDQFGFKKFRITIRNRKWRLEGKMNPWVLLANGQIIEVDEGTFKNPKAGKNVTLDGQRGVILGKSTPQVTEQVAQSLIQSGHRIDDIARFANTPGGLEFIQKINKIQGIDPKRQAELFEIASKHGIMGDITKLLENGSLQNPQKLGTFIREIKEGKAGNLFELEIANRSAKKGHQIELDTQGDVVDLTAKEVVQAKNLNDTDKMEAFFDRIKEADHQLGHRSTTGTPKQPGDEQPLEGFTRISEVKVGHPNHPLVNADRKAIKKAINDEGISWGRSEFGDNATQKIRITTNKGTFEFTLNPKTNLLE